MSEYADLISSTHASFSIEDDIGALSRIATSLHHSRVNRAKKRGESEALLGDTIDLFHARNDELRALEAQRNEDHGSLMNALDREKFSLVKEINDLESGAHKLEAQVIRIQQSIDTLPDSAKSMEDAYGGTENAVLKLSIYRNLGITLVQDEGKLERLS